jgi:hypothetical protein
MATLALAGIGLSCRGGPAAGRVPEPSPDQIGERYVRLTLQLAQHQPSLVESWLGPAGWRPGARRPVAEIGAEIGDVSAAMAELMERAEPNERLAYLQQQLAALAVAARRLSGESMPFADEAAASLGGDVGKLVRQLDGPVFETDAALEAARADLHARLPGRGALHERYAAFRSRHALSPAHVARGLQAAVEGCRRRVLAHIPLPESEQVGIETATGLGLEGQAIYEGDFRSRVVTDTSGPIDLARLLWLVAHETYPGHHLQHVLADRDLLRARNWHERALHPAFGRHLLCSEGAAEAGAALLLDGAAFEEACAEVGQAVGHRRTDVTDLVAVHRAVAALDVVIAATARAYLDDQLRSDAAAEQLRTAALVTDPQRLLFVIERQRTRILAYPVGRRLVAAHLASAPGVDRWAELAGIATTMTLPST